MIGEEEETAEEVVLRLEDGKVEPVTRLRAGVPAPAPEAPTRLAAAEVKSFEARSVEPTVEEILELPPVEDSAAPVEEGWGSSRRRGPVLWGWFAAILLVCGGAAAWSVRHLAANREAVQVIRAEASELDAVERHKDEQARQLLGRIERRLEGYLGAADPAGMLAHVRQRERVEPLMKDWYGRHPFRAEPLRAIRVMQPVTLGRGAFWVVRVDTAGGQRSLLLEQDGSDELWVDWETDVCYQPMDWDEFVTKRPEGLHDFRVTATLDSFHAHEFSDAKVYQCLRLTAKGGAEHLFAYVRRGCADEERLAEAFADSNGAPVSLVLKLGFLPGSKAARSVSVVSVVAVRWCLDAE